MDVDEVHRFRNEKVGFVFQFHYLLPELTALENVLLQARNLNLNKEKEGWHFLKNLISAHKRENFQGKCQVVSSNV